METETDIVQKLIGINKIIADMYKNSLALAAASQLLGFEEWKDSFIEINHKIADIWKEVSEYSNNTNVNIDFEGLLDNVRTRE